MRFKILYIGFFLLLATLAAAQCPGPAQRTALINLQRAIEVEGTRAGQIPLSDTCGNQRYAQYVEVNLDTIAYTPTPTGNVANLSEFVIDPTGAIFYIDWQGNSIEFAGGGSSCDVDWLQISDNSCPDAITDSIYHYRYASVGARLVWPGAEFLVNDSTTSAILVVQGSRNSRGAYYDSNAGTFSMFDHGGTTPIFYFPNNGVFDFKTTGGTPQSPSGTQVNHLSIRAIDSTLQFWRYPSSRVDTAAINNFLYTDATGKVRSNTPAALVSDAGGVTGSATSGQVTYWNGTSTITGASRFTFNNTGGATTPHLRLRASTTQFQPAFRIDSIPNDGIGLQVRGYASNTIYPVSGTANITTGTQDIAISLSNFSTNPAAFSFVDLFSSGGGSITKYGSATNTYFCGNDNGTFKINWTNTDAFSTAGINVSSTSSNVGIGAINSVSTKLYVSGSARFDLGSDATGDIFYRNVSGNFTRLPIGTAGQVLTVAAGLPSWAAPAGGGGTVTSFSAGNLSPLFTTNVATATTTPALTFTLNNQTANTVFAGPTSGGAAAPTFRALVAADIPSSAAGGFFKDGGNSFGATATLGTNDANTLSFETNNITRASLNTSGVWNVTDESATTNTVVVREQIGNNSSGTPATGFGTRTEFYAESSTTANRLQGFIQSRWSTATDVTRASEMDYGVVASGGTEVLVMTMEASGDVGIGTTSPFCRLSNQTTAFGDGVNVESGGFGWGGSSSSGYAGGVQNSSGASGANGFLAKCSATDNGTRALTASVGTTRILAVTGDSKVGVLDDTPETELDVTGTTATNHLTGQNLTPTITVNTAGAGTGATASMVNAQSSDLAGRFSITSGTGATTGLWATITFDDAFATTPIVQVYNEDADSAALNHYVNVNTTSFEFLVASGQSDATTYDFNFIIIGGK
mgnify:CR=1 FL=1